MKSIYRRHSQKRLVGRQEELHVLLKHLDRREQHWNEESLIDPFTLTPLKNEQPSLPHGVVLVGEGGIGKTRLAKEVSMQAKRRGWSLLESRGYAQESHIPYRLWIDVLQQALSLGIWQPHRRDMLPENVVPLLTALVPNLAMLVPQKEGFQESWWQEPWRFWQAIGMVLTMLSKKKPLLLVVDNMQWIDRTSLECLQYLLRRLGDVPLLVIGTYCAQYISHPHVLDDVVSRLHAIHTIEILNVLPLAEEHIRTILSRLPYGHPLSESMLQKIQTEALGNPFFAEELARSPSLARTSAIDAALESRLSGLSLSCQALLQQAALLGQDFAFSVITQMLVEQSGISEHAVLNLLEEALHQRILQERKSGSHITYRFRPPLLIDYLHTSCPISHHFLSQEYKNTHT